MIRIIAVVVPALLLAGCFAQSPAPAEDRSPPVSSRGAAPAAAPAGPGYYTVKRGDTLYRIALEQGQDYRDIVAWNNIANPAAIKEGQVLRVAPPGAVDAGGGAVAKPIAAAGGVESRSLDKGPAAVPESGGAVRREPRVNKEAYSDEAYARLGRGDAPPAKPVEAKPAEPRPAEAKPEVAAAAGGAEDGAWLWPTSGKVIAGYSDNGSKGIDIAGKAGDPVLAAAEGKVLYAGNAIKGYGNLVIIGHAGGLNSVYAHNRKILVAEKQQVSKGQKIAEMGNSDSDTVKLHFEIRRQGRPVDPLGYLPKR